jgi:predicted transcriptional regulator
MVSVRLDAALVQALRQLASERNATVSDLLRQAAEDLVAAGRARG